MVDYLGLADELRKALAIYTEAGGTGKTALDQAEAVALMLAKYEVCQGLFHGFDWSRWTVGTPLDRLATMPVQAMTPTDVPSTARMTRRNC